MLVQIFSYNIGFELNNIGVYNCYILLRVKRLILSSLLWINLTAAVISRGDIHRRASGFCNIDCWLELEGNSYREERGDRRERARVSSECCAGVLTHSLTYRLIFPRKLWQQATNWNSPSPWVGNIKLRNSRQCIINCKIISLMLKKSNLIMWIHLWKYFPDLIQRISLELT